MPVYDYTCGACGRTVEVIHGIHVEGPQFCPACGVEGRMKKTVGAPAVVFKGSGWAKKDRRATAGSSRSKSADESKSAGRETNAATAGGSSDSDGASTAGARSSSSSGSSSGSDSSSSGSSSSRSSEGD